MKMIALGSEAAIYDAGDCIIKRRIKKNYRIGEIDSSLRRSRTLREFKILSKCYSAGFKVPKPLSVSDSTYTIKMEKISGLQLDSCFDIDFIERISREIAGIHKLGVIHGDLTTANMIAEGKEVYIIDFGLGYFSLKPEDRASDLFLMKNALISRHPKKAAEAYRLLLKAYEKSMGKEFKEIETHLKDIEKRRRYHESS